LVLAKTQAILIGFAFGPFFDRIELPDDPHRLGGNGRMRLFGIDIFSPGVRPTSGARDVVGMVGSTVTCRTAICRQSWRL
jgi:hypothetical protein